MPFEVDGLARHERPEINTEAVRHMNPVEDVSQSDIPIIEGNITPSAPSTPTIEEASSAPASNSTWQPIEEASESDGVDISTRISVGLIPSDTPGLTEEAALMADIDMALAEVDSASDMREGTENGVTPPADPVKRDALDDLERELSDIDM